MLLKSQTAIILYNFKIKRIILIYDPIFNLGIYLS